MKMNIILIELRSKFRNNSIALGKAREISMAGSGLRSPGGSVGRWNENRVI